MNRQQRIEFEILDCVLKADPVMGYQTDTYTFTHFLADLFPDIQSAEFIQISNALITEGRLHVRVGGSLCDRVALTETFSFVRGPSSRRHFELLRTLIELPPLRDPPRKPREKTPTAPAYPRSLGRNRDIPSNAAHPRSA